MELTNTNERPATTITRDAINALNGQPAHRLFAKIGAPDCHICSGLTRNVGHAQWATEVITLWACTTQTCPAYEGHQQVITAIIEPAPLVTLAPGECIEPDNGTYIMCLGAPDGTCDHAGTMLIECDHCGAISTYACAHHALTLTINATRDNHPIHRWAAKDWNWTNA